jgi:hypothetical protein
MERRSSKLRHGVGSSSDLSRDQGFEGSLSSISFRERF